MCCFSVQKSTVMYKHIAITLYTTVQLKVYKYKSFCTYSTRTTRCTYTVYRTTGVYIYKNAVKMYVYMVTTYYSLYMSSTRSEYFSRIIFRFILRVGVNSPPGMLRSTGRMRNFCIFAAREMLASLALSNPAWM